MYRTICEIWVERGCWKEMDAILAVLIKEGYEIMRQDSKYYIMTKEVE